MPWVGKYSFPLKNSNKIIGQKKEKPFNSYVLAVEMCKYKISSCNESALIIMTKWGGCLGDRGNLKKKMGCVGASVHGFALSDIKIF